MVSHRSTCGRMRRWLRRALTRCIGGEPLADDADLLLLCKRYQHSETRHCMHRARERCCMTLAAAHIRFIVYLQPKHALREHIYALTAYLLTRKRHACNTTRRARENSLAGGEVLGLLVLTKGDLSCLLRWMRSCMIECGWVMQCATAFGRMMPFMWCV